MSLLDSISQPEVWEKFYDYKTSLACPKDIERQLRGFLDVQGYLPITGEFQASENSPFPLPKKKIISKQSSHKKRVVYTYPN
ncbi:MAG: hypothetical protein J6Q02_01865, partial [Lachnospiraceae bacterium]|nr:hypothetical protein [Lachnospiraceae bacterium]